MQSPMAATEGSLEVVVVHGRATAGLPTLSRRQKTTLEKLVFGGEVAGRSTEELGDILEAKAPH